MRESEARLHQDVGRALGLLEGLDGKLTSLHSDLRDHMAAEEARIDAIEVRVGKNEGEIRGIAAKVTLISSVIGTVAVTGLDWFKKNVLHL